jgi:tetratricopeptide (TPR) repeat protein
MNAMDGTDACCGLNKTSLVRLSLLLVAAVIVGVLAPRGDIVSPDSQLTVTSDPAGATIFINGRLAGATPLVLPGLKAGGYSIRIERENFIPVTRTVRLSRGDTVLNESLPAVATEVMRVDIKPEGAEVLLDGEFQGHTPLYLPEVSAGEHELVVRKTNFNTYTRRIQVDAGQPLKFSDELEDKVLTMLNGNIAKEPTRVAHYVDLAHYLFVNNKIPEAAEIYAQALEVSAAPLEFAQNVPTQERQLEVRLRAEDQNRLNEELRKKEHWPGKDLAAFVKTIEHARELAINAGSYKDWKWAREMANNYVRDGRVEDAQRLLLRHIDAVKSGHDPDLAQAYIDLMSVRLKMKKIDLVRESYKSFMNLYGQQAQLLRQAGNAVYSAHSLYDGRDRSEVLDMSEAMFRKGVSLSRHGDGELKALCNFELGNVLVLQSRHDQAIQPFKESIDDTKDVSTKEIRSQRLVECYKVLRRFDDARKALTDLAKSKSGDIAERARQELKEIELLEPSPDKDKK